MVGDPTWGEPATRVVPGGDAIEGRQEDRRRDGRIGDPERSAGHAGLDVAAEARFVGVSSTQDGGAALGAKRSPLVDEHGGLADVRHEDRDVGPDERAQGFDCVAGAAGLDLRFGGVRRDFEPACCAVDDGPEDVLLGGDVGIQARALDLEGPRDVADARARVAVRPEEVAGDVLDGAAAGDFDHLASS